MVGGVAQFHLAFNVDDARVAHRGHGGNAHRATEGCAVSHLVDRQAVDLSDYRVACRQQQEVLVDHLVDLLGGQVQTVLPRLQRPPHSRRGNHRYAVLSGPIVGLLRHVGQNVQTRADFALAPGGTHAPLDQRRHGLTVARTQARFAANTAEEAGDLQDGLVPARQRDVEVGLDLEQAPETGVLVGQVLVEFLVAEQDDLHVARDRLRLQRRGRHQGMVINGLDFRPAVAQQAFQRRPDDRVVQGLLGAKDEVAAVGTVDGPGADAHEVAAPGAAVLDRRLDGAEEVLVGR